MGHCGNYLVKSPYVDPKWSKITQFGPKSSLNCDKSRHSGDDSPIPDLTTLSASILRKHRPKIGSNSPTLIGEI